MKDIKILVATHKKYQMPEDEMYLPIHVGKEGKEDIGFQGDNTGENISKKNPNYCELTGLYWAWKNLDGDYIGLSHYRRYFKTTEKTSEKGMFAGILKEHEALKILDSNDIIIPRKRNYFIESVESHYKNAHHIKDLQETRKIVEEKYPNYMDSFNKVMNGSKLHLYNMFIMEKRNFDQYCEWLFDILGILESRVDTKGYDTYQSRLYGFLSERLFNVWIQHNQLKIKELDVYSIERVNYSEKAFNFLKRKLLG